MKIFTFTDPHGDKKIISTLVKKIKTSQPDLILCAGDLTNFGVGLKNLILKFKPLHLPLLIIPGNHETTSELTNVCKKTKFAINLHKKSYQISNYVFFGYGLGGFEAKSQDLEKIIPKLKTRIKNKKLILITHQPPHNTKLDYMKNIGHQGNKSITKFIKSLKPLVAISGHLHENENKKDKILKTLVLNPGHKGKVLKV